MRLSSRQLAISSQPTRNGWLLMANRYVLKISDSALAVKQGIQLAKDPAYAKLLTAYMIKQSANKTPLLNLAVAGKSGTPERVWKKESINDGWYVFFAPKPSGVGNMVVCIRVESTKGSSDAVRVAATHVIPFLLEKKYIRSIAPPQPAKTEEIFAER